MSDASAWRLSGVLAVVSGASKGIGLATVHELSNMGATVIGVARDTSPLRGLGPSIIAVEGDATAPQTHRAVADAVADQGGALGVLVNNAGTNIRKPTLEYSDDDFDRVLDLNLKAAWSLSRVLFPALSVSGRASVVNVSSVAASRAVRPSSAAYSASKGAVESLTRFLAAEWAPHGIRVNAVAPWYIRTPLVQTVLSDPAKVEQILARTPLGRLGEPEDVARAIAFLACPAAAYVTGTVLDVDGGFTALGA